MTERHQENKTPKNPDAEEHRGFSFVGNIRHSITKRFGIALQTRRKQLGMTQAELAGRVGMSRSYISEIECGRESVSLERANQLAQALDCQLADLIQEQEP